MLTAPQPLADQVPPRPLSIDEAGNGLTVSEISKLNGHSEVAIYGAINRLKVAHLLFKRIRLYSADQAGFLLRNMRSPDNGSGKRRPKSEPPCRPS